MWFKMSTEMKNILQNYITDKHDLDSKYFCPGAVTCPITFAFSFKDGKVKLINKKGKILYW